MSGEVFKRINLVVIEIELFKAREANGHEFGDFVGREVEDPEEGEHIRLAEQRKVSDQVFGDIQEKEVLDLADRRQVGDFIRRKVDVAQVHIALQEGVQIAHLFVLQVQGCECIA